MMVVGQEVVLDLTDETEDPRQVLKRACQTALNSDIQEFTLVSHLDTPFLVRDLTDILRHTKRLEYLSLFSIALSGTAADFHDYAAVLRGHSCLREVHMVDCGMYGNYAIPGGDSSVSSAGTGHASKGTKYSTTSSAHAAASSSSGVKSAKRAKYSSDSSSTRTKDSRAMISMCSHAPATMDVILHALASIRTLENVELYGIPNEKFDLSGDGDQESGHQVVGKEGGNSDDIPMVPMAPGDTSTFSDDDFLDDYAEDIRGIPGCRRGKNSNKKLTLLMSPEAIGALCRAPALTNMGLEDLNLQDDHLEQMMLSLSAKESRMKELKIWGCNLSDRSAEAIARMLLVNTTLERLDLAHNHINDKGCIAIAKALHSNTTLISLNLMGNECANNYDAVSEGGCYEALMELMQKNKTLTDLVLETYEQDDESDVPEYIFIPASVTDDASSATDPSLDGTLAKENPATTTMGPPQTVGNPGPPQTVNNPGPPQTVDNPDLSNDDPQFGLSNEDPDL